jgi:hypothetical protein
LLSSRGYHIQRYKHGTSPTSGIVDRGVTQQEEPRGAKDLLTFLKKHIFGDFNEVLLGEESRGMAQIQRELRLMDIMAYHHGIANHPNSWIRGKDRINFPLGTKHVAKSVTRCGYDQFNFRISSDHRGTYYVVRVSHLAPPRACRRTRSTAIGRLAPGSRPVDRERASERASWSIY